MSVFSHPDFDGHQWLSFKHDADSGLKAIIAIHNSNLGPATGGCRMFPYASDDEALSDVLRLSRGMTYKSALAGLPFGGGKSVIIGDPQRDKSRELLLAMGDFIESHSGRYTVAEDSGTTAADMAVIAERSEYVSGLIKGDEQGGDPSPSTAYGVFLGIRSAVEYRFGRDLDGIRVGVQGVGNVGYHLAKRLVEAGAKVYACDVNASNLQRAVSQLGVVALSTEALMTADIDVFSPCAMGGVITATNIATMKAKVIAGAANNQLCNGNMGDLLSAQGIVYAPDYVINAGGIIDVYYQLLAQRNQETVHNHVGRIANTLATIFKRADQEGMATNRIADLMAEAVFKHPLSDSKVA